MGEDWVYLALLGVIMAILSYVMDKGIAMCTNGKHIELTMCNHLLILCSLFDFCSQSMAVQRPNVPACSAVFRMGFITGMFNIILSGICSFNSASEYRYL